MRVMESLIFGDVRKLLAGDTRNAWLQSGCNLNTSKVYVYTHTHTHTHTHPHTHTHTYIHTNIHII